MLLVVGIVIFFLYKLHSLAVEGNNIFEYRCLQVNPPLIAYKNAFLKFADYLKNPNAHTGDQVKEFLDNYIAGMRAYIPEESKWLETQRKFIDRWDYQLIEPWYIKEAGEHQWKMYEGYRDDAVTLLITVDNPESAKDIRPGYVSEARQRRDSYSQKYFEFFKKASQISDWRKFFGSVPVPEGCTEENMYIPNTSGSIDWDRDSKEATPSGVPIDPYGVS